MPKYTILVPVYNKLDCLRKYFYNILNQSFTDYEIIVVDDCSTDGSYEYLTSINDCRLHVYKNDKNVGLGENRNILLRRANGEYVLFVDPDDYIELDLLLKVEEANENLDVIRFQNVIEPVTIRQKELEQGKDKYRMCCDPTDVISGEEALMSWCLGERKINTMPWTYVIKRELYDDVVYPKTSILEDFAITPYLIAKAKKVKAIPFVGYHYLKYDDSLTSSNENLGYIKNKLELFKGIVSLTGYYMDRTNISDKNKEIFMEDVKNRYLVREQKFLQLLREKGGN